MSSPNNGAKDRSQNNPPTYTKPAHQEEYDGGWTIHLDNDSLVPGVNRDQDYTGGLGFSLIGRQARDQWWSIDGMLDTANRWSRFDEFNEADRFAVHSAQLGLLVFSPADVGDNRSIYEDRPFANLLYVANSRRVIEDLDSPIYESTLTLGVLGTQLGATLQNTIHDAIGAHSPRGWSQQISDGGELTFQYTIAKQDLLLQRFWGENSRYELKYGLATSVGYITETTLALTNRWGITHTPWWSFSPESAEYASQPAAVVGDLNHSNTPDLYLWGGIKLRARVYNVFLQGQFRDSEVTFDPNELNHLLAEAWVGVTSQFNGFRLSYVVRYQSREIKEGLGARDPIWGGLLFSMNF